MQTVLAQLVSNVEPYNCIKRAGSDKVLYRQYAKAGYLLWGRYRTDQYFIDLWYSRVELHISKRHHLSGDAIRERDAILREAAKRDAELYEAIRDIKGRARLLWLIRQRTRVRCSGVGKLPTEICLHIHAIVNRLTMAEHSMYRARVDASVV
jgi:hypothetical protein